MPPDRVWLDRFPQQETLRIDPDGGSFLIFTCPYCGTEKPMVPSRFKISRTCGDPACRTRNTAEHGGSGCGRRQSPEHIAARTAARKANGSWFADHEVTGAN